MNNTLKLAFVLCAAVAGCKGKDKDAAPAPTTTEPVAKPTELPAAAPAPTAAKVLASGETKLGCVAWSETLKTAACVIGEKAMNGPTYSLVSVGQAALNEKVADTVDDAAALSSNALLAKHGFAPLAGTPKLIVDGTPADAGAGAVLTRLTKTTDSKEDNVAPTVSTKLTAKCGTGEAVLLDSTDEGLDYQPTVRVVGGFAIIELAATQAREGEYTSSLDVVVLDTATCKTVSTIPQN